MDSLPLQTERLLHLLAHLGEALAVIVGGRLHSPLVRADANHLDLATVTLFPDPAEERSVAPEEPPGQSIQAELQSRLADLSLFAHCHVRQVFAKANL